MCSHKEQRFCFDQQHFSSNVLYRSSSQNKKTRSNNSPTRKVTGTAESRSAPTVHRWATNARHFMNIVFNAETSAKEPLSPVLANKSPQRPVSSA